MSARPFESCKTRKTGQSALIGRTLTYVDWALNEPPEAAKMFCKKGGTRCASTADLRKTAIFGVPESWLTFVAPIARTRSFVLRFKVQLNRSGRLSLGALLRAIHSAYRAPLVDVREWDFSARRAISVMGARVLFEGLRRTREGAYVVKIGG